jgi:hypothetical protein
MRGVLWRVCLLGVAAALPLALTLPAAAEKQTTVTNVLSPFSTIQVIGSRPPPKPPYQWSPECNQGFIEWKPVCAVTRHRIVVTYSNRCMAEIDGAVVIMDRECPRRVSCPYTYEPVCARIMRINRSGRELPLKEALKPPPLEPFINECFAKTLPDRVAGQVPPIEAERELQQEITILRKYGDDIYFQTPPKHARGKDKDKDKDIGHKYRYYGRTGLEDFGEVCPTRCPEGGLLVCARDHNGLYRLYKNRCSAIMDGADPNVFRPGDLSKCK